MCGIESRCKAGIPYVFQFAAESLEPSQCKTEQPELLQELELCTAERLVQCKELKLGNSK